MDEIRVPSEEKIAAAVPVEVPIPEAPKEDAAVPSPVPADAAEPDQKRVQIADVWTNGEYSFRVDQITPIGSVRIRFRTDANLDPKPLSPNRILAFFKRKENAPDGEWFFGSVEEFERFAAEGGYSLEKRGKSEA
ncbi:MAG: hypothetical protein KA731_03560 [Candidatus Moranbacteria bacterium]|nr:hypothetical protein [Candidatus Moranbacteria bacterium]MBP6034274.1 hypothetical protein [Candidatus Moranbacteria bacterium]MBP7695900.1 hypothetical protein [Candidatus Moranbacteria bacterium]